MSALLLRLAAPMQSWGVDSNFDKRVTERLPTKSGVIGLIAAALGRRRNDSLEDLRVLHFGVRIDREGVLLRDYHTAKSEVSSYVTHRYYLCDAIFLAGLEGDEALLEVIESAIRRPAFPLFLGRRACPPEGQLSLGIRRGKHLYEALREEPRLANDQLRRKADPDVPLHIVADGTKQDANGYFQRDVPLSFDQTHRQFGFRRVNISDMNVPSSHDNHPIATECPTEHDPMSELEEE